MNTQEKILLLNNIVETIGLSQTEYEQWLRQNKFSLESAEKSVETLRIKTPLPLVYIKDGEIEVLPYLDLDRKDEIWGIQSGGQAVKLTHENGGERMNWNEAVKAITVSGESLALPSREEFELHRKAKDRFNETVELLQAHSVEAESWKEAWYWTTEEYSSDFVYGYRMYDGYSGYGNKDIGNYVRVVLPL